MILAIIPLIVCFFVVLVGGHEIILMWDCLDYLSQHPGQTLSDALSVLHKSKRGK